ncbi:MAG: class I SAM-dependent rRNA methyltransferase [Eubacteriaceae bacterium]|nr:class I SAM-dependent rRNA methyltransferase [Eubacteriaceae bacterium]
MKIQRNYPAFTVTKKGQRWLEGAHPWLYEDEIVQSPEEMENGGLADIFSQEGKYLGTGLYSEKSKIRLRLISSNANDTFDDAFWERRVRYAWEYRKSVMSAEDLNCCRVIFGEADQFPGLTVDRYSDYLVAQTMSYGMERLKSRLFPIIYRVLNEDTTIKGIYERNDDALRALEGLEENKGWYIEGVPKGEDTSFTIEENGVKYMIDIENGQKTGFYPDQKYNRLSVGKIARGKNVLDCFTHTGSFALNAALGGAKKVTGVDISASAIKLARENAKLNGVEADFVVQDAFDYLDTVTKGQYDLIILDPPAFTKSRKTIKNAYRGYRDINHKAMKALGRGGYLASCSCSHFMSSAMFEDMLKEAAKMGNFRLRSVETRQQACDHPILWNVPETNYLKFYILQVV